MSRTGSGAALVPQAGASSQKKGRDNFLFWPIGIGIIVGFQSITALPFLVGALQDARGYDLGQIGFITGAEIACMAVAVLVLAPNINRWPRHYLAFGAACMLALAQAASALVVDFVPFVMLRALAGVSGGVIAAVLNASVSLARSPERVSGYAMGLATLTDLALFLSLGWAIGEAGAFGAYMLLAAMTLVLLPTMLLFPARAAPTPPLTAAVLKAGLLILLAIPCYAAGQTAIWSHVERIGVGSGLPASFIAFALGLGGIGGVASALLASRLGTRFGSFWPIIGSTILLTIFACALLFVRSPTGFLVAYCGFVFFYIFKEPFMLGLAARLDSQGRIVAAGSGTGLLGVSLGAAFAGQSVDWSGGEFAVLAWLLVGFVGLGFLLVAPLAWRAPRG